MVSVVVKRWTQVIDIDVTNHWFRFHSGQETPDIHIETENMTFNVGEEVNLLCSIKNLRLLTSAKWIREETKQILETANFSNVENSESHYHRFSHIIDKVSTDDAGYYTCVVTFDGRGRQTLSYKLQVTGKWFLSRSSVFNFARLSVFWFYLVLRAYLFCSSRL